MGNSDDEMDNEEKPNKVVQALLPGNTGLKAWIPYFFVLTLLCIIVWDIRKVHEISEIIHDDHISYWVPMNESLLSRWYTPLDLCMMEMNRTDMGVKEYRKKYCHQFMNYSRDVPSARLYCDVGSSFGKACSPPFEDRTFFKWRLRNDILGDPDGRYLSNVLRLFAQHHRAVVFMGDGISRQNQEAMICEIMRTDDVHVLYGREISSYNRTVSAFNVRWKDGSNLQLNVLFVKVFLLYQENKPKETILFRRRFMRSRGNDRKGNNTNQRDRRAKLELVERHRAVSEIQNGTGKVSLDLPDLQGIVKEFLNHTQGMVIIANIGVWYNSRLQYRLEMPRFLGWLNDLGKNNLVFYRETAAQHWNFTEYGYYDLDMRQSDNGSCVPIADATPGNFYYDLFMR